MEQLRLADELGSFAVTHPPLDARPMIVALTAEGCGSWVIARRLNEAGVSTSSGRGQWHPATVRRFMNPGPWAASMRRYRHRPG